MENITESLPTIPKNESGTNDQARQESFDPNIHRQDAKGQPIRNKDGSLRRKPGAKPKARQAPPPASLTNSTMPVAASTEMPTAASAAVFVDTLESIASIFLSPAWKMTEVEKTEMVKSYDRLFERHGIKEFSPLVSVLICSTAYASTRIATDQPTRSTFARAWQGARFQFTRRAMEGAAAKTAGKTAGTAEAGDTPRRPAANDNSAATEKKND